MAYCGFMPGEDPIWSADFTAMLGIKGVRRLEDVQQAIQPADAAALEGLFIQLQDNQEPFILDCVAEETGACIRLHGRIGVIEGHKTPYTVLWAQDISNDKDNYNDLSIEYDAHKKNSTTLNAVMDHLPTPVWAKDGADALIYCNKAYADWVKTSRSDAIAHNTSLPLVVQKDSLSFENRGRIIIDGKRRIVDVVERDLQGEKIKAGFVIERTDEDRLNTELTRQNSATQELLGNLSSAIAVFAADTSLEFYNTSFSALWTLKESFLNTRPHLGVLMEQLREDRKLPEQVDFRQFKKSWTDLFTSLLEPKQEMLYLPDGRALRMMTIPHPMGGLMMTFEDVTSRLELESSYNTLIAVQRETLDTLKEGVAVYGSNGQIRLWNPSFKALWGLSDDVLIKQPHASALALHKKSFFDDNWPDMQKVLIGLALDRTDNQTEIMLSDGRHLECVTAPLPDGGTMVTFRDITDTILAEQSLQDKNRALEAADNLKTEFLANVSYQLRTPLNAIMGFGEILTNGFFGSLNERQQEYAHGITEAGGRLTTLIDDILDLSSIEAGKLELEIQPTNIHTLLNDLFDITRDWAAKDELTVRLECAEDIGEAHIDPRRIKQAFINLVQNAIAYTEKGGTITLAAAAKGKNHIELSVKDTGIGMADDEKVNLLKPFIRGQAHDNGGTGLGLTIVQHMTQLHGGELVIESRLGVGTNITMTLPRKQAGEKEAAA